MGSDPVPAAATAPSSRMRIALVTDAIPDRNGVGTYYRDLCSHLQDRVARVELICPEQTETGWRDRIRLPLPGDATQKVCIPGPRYLGRRFADLKPQAVVLSTPGPYGFMGLRLARKYDANIVAAFHTNLEKLTELYWQNSRLFGRLSKWYLESGNRVLFRSSATVLVNSEEMIGVAKKIGARDVELMGTTIARPFIVKPVTPLREEFTTVTFAGRLAAEKNLESVIAAAEALPRIGFRIAGDGPERDRIESAARRLSNLSYLGWLPRERMPELIDTTDLLVLPSHVESFGTIALEAMARNRLVLVSRNCGISQWPRLRPGLFQIGADESVAQAVARIAGLSPALRRQTAQRARSVACELNEWTVNHWLDVLARPAPAGQQNG